LSLMQRLGKMGRFEIGSIKRSLHITNAILFVNAFSLIYTPGGSIKKYLHAPPPMSRRSGLRRMLISQRF